MEKPSKIIEITLSIDFDVFCEEIFPRLNEISTIPLGVIIRQEFLRQLTQSASNQISQLIPKIRVEGSSNYCGHSQKVQSFAKVLSRDWFVPLDDPYEYDTGIVVSVHADNTISDLYVSVNAPLCILDEPDLQLWKYRRIAQKKLTKHMHRVNLNYPSDVFEPFRTSQCDCELPQIK